MSQHFGSKKEDWKSEVYIIEFSIFKNPTTRDIYEIYLIDLYKPKYNKSNKYENEYTEIKLPIPKFINLDLFENINKENLNDISEKDIEDIVNRYEIHILKDYKNNPIFYNIGKNNISDDTIYKLKRKMENSLKFITKFGGGTKNLKYITHPSNMNLFTDKITIKSFLNITHKDDNSFYFLLLYDIHINEKQSDFKKSEDLALNLLLSFMKNNKGVDKFGKTYLFIASKRMFNLLNTATNGKLNIVKMKS